MHKNFSRFLALSAIAALTIFAGKTFTESREQSLYAETPVEAQAVSYDGVSVAPAVQTAVPAPETAHAVQVSIADTDANPPDSAIKANSAQSFSIKKGSGDDDDDREDDE